MHTHTTFDLDNISNTYKYTIWRRWQNLTRAEQAIAKKKLPKLIGVAPRTLFERWMYYRIDDNKTIPADALYQLATFFGCDIKGMWTTPPESLHITSIQIKTEANKDDYFAPLAH